MQPGFIAHVRMSPYKIPSIFLNVHVCLPKNDSMWKIREQKYSETNCWHPKIGRNPKGKANVFEPTIFREMLVSGRVHSKFTREFRVTPFFPTKQTFRPSTKSENGVTLPQTNKLPMKKWWLGRQAFPFGSRPIFKGRFVSFGGCIGLFGPRVGSRFFKSSFN